MFLELLEARWGKPTRAAEKAAASQLGAAQSRGANAGMGEEPARPQQQAPRARAAAQKPKPKPRPGARPSISVPVGGFTAAPPIVNASVAPTAPAAPATAPAAASGSCVLDDDDDDREQLRGDAEETLPEAEANAVVGDYSTALKTVTALLEVHLELGAPWDDDCDATRKAKGAAAQDKGAVWAQALRAHSGDSVGHYYCHLAFAHFEELIVANGHCDHGNDEVLEKGNRTVKSYRDMSFKGGSSAAGKAKQKQRRWRKEGREPDAGRDSDSALEEYSVVRENNVGVIEYTTNLQTAADLIESRRSHEASLNLGRGKRKQAKRAKRETAASVKSENLSALKAVAAPNGA